MGLDHRSANFTFTGLDHRSANFTFMGLEHRSASFTFMGLDHRSANFTFMGLDQKGRGQLCIPRNQTTEVNANSGLTGSKQHLEVDDS